jgi:hypothetical protein
VFLNHVVIVEQPLAGWANIGHAVAISVPVADCGKPAMRVFEDAAGVIEASEQWRASGPSPDSQSLAGRDLLGPLGQVLGTKQLAANGAGEAVLAVRTDEGHDEGE